MAMEANKDYVITHHQLSDLLRDNVPLRSRVYRISDLDPRLVNFNVSSRKVGTQRLLLYNGSGGYGDQILTWPLGKLLSDLGFEVSVLSDPGNMVCWSNFPWVKATLSLPLSYEVFRLFDYHVIFNVVVNADEHQDQAHTLDTMLHKVGIEPLSVANERKVVAPVFTAGEVKSMMGAFPDKQLAIYQLSAAVFLRSLTPDESVALLKSLALAFPDWHWLAVHDEFIPKDYPDKATALGLQNVQTMCHPVLRELWALTKRANVVVAPDSMMVHAAGSMGVPCVGLWGPVNPKNRVRYYKNHQAVFKPEACPHAPCHCCGAEFPRYCPKRETRKQCDVLTAISHSDVIEAVRIATNSPLVSSSSSTPAVWSKELFTNT